MKMDKVASSQNDEFYTPEYAIKPILKYIKMPCTIWCPFDTEESNFVKLLSQYAACGVSVIHSHIATLRVQTPRATRRLAIALPSHPGRMS